MSQDRHAADLDFVDAVADWDGGSLHVEELRTPVRCTVYRPDIGGLLPVYVADRYEGIEARTFLECTDAEVEEYVARNVAAAREVAAREAIHVALANHLVMGPAILARALDEVPYAVKVHGSALEYVVKRDADRFGPWAREGLAPARAVLVGSRHTAESLWAAMGDPELPGRTRLGPPGVDIEQFAPREPDAAASGVLTLARTLHSAAPAGSPEPSSAFALDLQSAGVALGRLDPGRDRLVAFTGKLIVSKGVDLLAAAFPLVLAAEPDARLVIVGFGGYRDGLERLIAALAAGDLEAVRAVAEEGRALEGGPRAPLRHLLAFLDDLEAGDEREAYLAAAAGLGERVVLTGRLDHEQLAELLPACEAQVVPSTFPEAFGMVAAEAAACGTLPVSADHSGLAEVTRTLAAVVPPAAAPWLSFHVGPGAVRELAGCLIAWLQAPEELRAATRAALVDVARERYSWEGVARTVVRAAQGDLEALPPVV